MKDMREVYSFFPTENANISIKLVAGFGLIWHLPSSLDLVVSLVQEQTQIKSSNVPKLFVGNTTREAKQ